VGRDTCGQSGSGTIGDDVFRGLDEIAIMDRILGIRQNDPSDTGNNEDDQCGEANNEQPDA
jgi:hypothetical protein